MHLPDSALDPTVWVPLSGVAAGGVVVAQRTAGWADDDRRIPLAGVLGAFVFAAQMVNIPVGIGVSGHLVGSALLAILVGPSVAILVMACILIVQCLVLSDGGFTTLGANIVNLAIIGSIVGAWVNGGLGRLGRGRVLRLLVAPFMASWASVLVPSLAAAAELALSEKLPLWEALAFLGGYHTLVGGLEGFLTVAILRYVVSVRPDIVPPSLRGAAEARG